jgi:peroxiredoxin (alkyl hydroperoxide reductase subunit C)
MKKDIDELFEDYQEFPIRIGQSLPDMELSAYHKGKETKISLSDYKGKWLILFFYPADFTFICPTELEDMADHYAQFQKEGAEVLSVSTDTVYTHKAWHDTSEAIKKINFPMVSDRNQSLCYMMGAIDDESGNALRGTFVINPDGKLQMMELGDNDSVGRNAKELLRKLQGAKFAREHKGRVCPAKWEPGDDTLKPGMDLVGKI